MTRKIKSALLRHFNRCFCGISVGVFARVILIDFRKKKTFNEFHLYFIGNICQTSLYQNIMVWRSLADDVLQFQQVFAHYCGLQ